MDKTKITFRMANEVITVVVAGSVNKARATIKSMMDRKWQAVTFDDVETGRKVKVELAEVETYKCTQARS